MGGYKRVSLEETETTSLISEEGLSVTKPLEVKYHHTVHIIGSLVRLRGKKPEGELYVGGTLAKSLCWYYV